MNLYEKLKKDLEQYRINKDSTKLKLMQTLIGELNTMEKSKVVIDDTVVLKLIKVFINNNNKTIGMTNDQTMINKLNEENVLFQTYFPKMLSEDEIKQIIADNNLDSVPVGMKFFKENHNGKYDGKIVSSLLK